MFRTLPMIHDVYLIYTIIFLNGNLLLWPFSYQVLHLHILTYSSKPNDYLHNPLHIFTQIFFFIRSFLQSRFWKTNIEGILARAWYSIRGEKNKIPFRGCCDDSVDIVKILLNASPDLRFLFFLLTCRAFSH